MGYGKKNWVRIGYGYWFQVLNQSGICSPHFPLIYLLTEPTQPARPIGGGGHEAGNP